MSYKTRFGASALASAMLIGGVGASAEAKTLDGRYHSPYGYVEGGFRWIDCGRDCPEDNNLLITNRKSSFVVRVRFQSEAYGDGRWYTYLDKYIPDNSHAKLNTGFPPVGKRVRLVLCTAWKDTYKKVGKCEYMYGYNSAG